MADEEKDKINYARETVRILREQTDALKEQQKAAEQTTEQNKAQLGLSRALARVAAEQAKYSDDNLDNLKSSKDIAKDLLKAEKTRDALASEFKMASKSVQKLLAEQLAESKNLVKEEEKRLDKAKKIDNSMGLVGKSIGIVNKLLGGSLKDTKEIEENTRKRLASLEKENKLLPGLGGKMQGFGIQIQEVGKSLISGLNDPMTYLLLLLENSTSVNQFQKELGLSYGSAIGLRDEMSQIAMSTGDVFITSAKLQKSFFGMSESLGFIADFSGQTLETMTNLEQRLGLATGEAAEMTMLFKLQGNNTEEIASNTFDTLTNSIKLGNVAVTPKQVFEEIAKTTASIKVSLGANPEALGKAVIAAKQLGASLAQIDQIAASTLDFESSISSELEAELLTGKQLNLERARLLALNNDFAGVAEEITKQGIDFASFSTMNRIQQEAIASSLGLSRDTLSEMTLQQQMQTMSSEEIKNNFGEGAYQQSLSLSASEKFAASVEKVKSLFSDVMVILTPIIDGVALLADLVGKVVSVFGGFTPMLVAAVPLIRNMGLILRANALLGFKGAVAAIFRSFAGIPFGLGIPLALAAVGSFASLFKKGDDVGYGNNMLVTKNKGAIMLNNNDSVVAGTNLLGGGGGGTEIDYDKMASAMSKAQVNVSTKYDSFSSNSTTANGGRYQSTARYESKFV